MSFIGAIAGLVMGGAYVADGVKQISINNSRRKESINNNEEYYYDAKGKKRLVSNNHEIEFENDLATGDRVIRDKYNNTIIKNFSEIERSCKNAFSYWYCKKNGYKGYVKWIDQKVARDLGLIHTHNSYIFVEYSTKKYYEKHAMNYCYLNNGRTLQKFGENKKYDADFLLHQSPEFKQLLANHGWKF